MLRLLSTIEGKTNKQKCTKHMHWHALQRRTSKNKLAKHNAELHN